MYICGENIANITPDESSYFLQGYPSSCPHVSGTRTNTRALRNAQHQMTHGEHDLRRYSTVTPSQPLGLSFTSTVASGKYVQRLSTLLLNDLTCHLQRAWSILNSKPQPHDQISVPPRIANADCEPLKLRKAWCTSTDVFVGRRTSRCVVTSLADGLLLSWVVQTTRTHESPSAHSQTMSFSRYSTSI